MKLAFIGLGAIGKPMSERLIENGYELNLFQRNKKNKDDNRKYSIELEECEENDVPDMIDMFKTEKKLTFKELNLMGWKGEVIYSADIISLIHKCYNNVIFPKFVKPLSKGQFSGPTVMIQSRGAINRLQEKGCYSFTYYKDEYMPKIEEFGAE